MDIFNNLIFGFQVATSWQNLFFCFVGVLIGTLIGVLPGIGPTTGVAILIPVTFGMNATTAIITMAGVYYGAMYGGSTTSILLNVPGESASVVTTLDGYQMAKAGRAGPALGMAALSSFIAGTFAVLMLTLVGPPLADYAVSFGSPEYFALTFMGLTMVTSLGGSSPIKGTDQRGTGASGCLCGARRIQRDAAFHLRKHQSPERSWFHRCGRGTLCRGGSPGKHREPDAGNLYRGEADDAEHASEPPGLEGFLRGIMAGLDHRVFRRGAAGGGGDDRILHGLCRGEEVKQTSGEVRDGRDRGSGGAGRSE